MEGGGGVLRVRASLRCIYIYNEEILGWLAVQRLRRGRTGWGAGGSWREGGRAGREGEGGVAVEGGSETRSPGVHQAWARPTRTPESRRYKEPTCPDEWPQNAGRWRGREARASCDGTQLVLTVKVNILGYQGRHATPLPVGSRYTGPHWRRESYLGAVRPGRVALRLCGWCGPGVGQVWARHGPARRRAGWDPCPVDCQGATGLLSLTTRALLAVLPHPATLYDLCWLQTARTLWRTPRACVRYLASQRASFLARFLFAPRSLEPPHEALLVLKRSRPSADGCRWCPASPPASLPARSE